MKPGNCSAPGRNNHKSSLSKLNREIPLPLHAKCSADMMDDISRHSRLTVAAFLHNMTDIVAVYCEIRCQNSFVLTKSHFDSCFIIFSSSCRALLYPGSRLRGLHLLLLSGNCNGVQHHGKGKQVPLFCYCLNSNQRWHPIYQENGEAPEETNRIWVCQISGRRLSGAVKWPKHISVARKHWTGCSTKDRFKKNKKCECLEISFWSLNIKFELRVHVRPAALPFDLSSQCFPGGIPECPWEPRRSRGGAVQEESGFHQVFQPEGYYQPFFFSFLLTPRFSFPPGPWESLIGRKKIRYENESLNTHFSPVKLKWKETQRMRVRKRGDETR